MEGGRPDRGDLWCRPVYKMAAHRVFTNPCFILSQCHYSTIKCSLSVSICNTITNYKTLSLIRLLCNTGTRYMRHSGFPWRLETESGIGKVMEHEILAKSHGMLLSVMEFYHICPRIVPDLLGFFFNY